MLAFEAWLIQGFINMFGGNVFLTAMFFISMFFITMFLLRIPLFIVIPLGFSFVLFAGLLSLPILVIAVIIAGYLIGILFISIMGR